MTVLLYSMNTSISVINVTVFIMHLWCDLCLSQNALLVPSARAVSIAASVKTRHHVTMWAEPAPVRLAGLERSVKNVRLFHFSYINVSRVMGCLILERLCVCPACPQGFYGLDCQQKCVCMNGGLCDHVSGECACRPGWIGQRCNQSELVIKNEHLLIFTDLQGMCLSANLFTWEIAKVV